MSDQQLLHEYVDGGSERAFQSLVHQHVDQDRKSTRLNSSHGYISYAVFCLKKKNTQRSKEFQQLHTLCVLDLKYSRIFALDREMNWLAYLSPVELIRNRSMNS